MSSSDAPSKTPKEGRMATQSNLSDAQALGNQVVTSSAGGVKRPALRYHGWCLAAEVTELCRSV